MTVGVGNDGEGFETVCIVNARHSAWDPDRWIDVCPAFHRGHQCGADMRRIGHGSKKADSSAQPEDVTA